VTIHTAVNTPDTQQTAPQTLKNYKVLIQVTNTTRNANYKPLSLTLTQNPGHLLFNVRNMIVL